MNYPDEHFRLFAGQIERAILKYGSLDEITVVARQKEQIERLVDLEKKFRKTLIKHPWGPGVYRDFVSFIMDDRRNILAARPYFRERQEVFSDKIAKTLKNRRANGLYKFHFNYQFIRFVMTSRNWTGNRIGSKVVKLAKEIEALRTELVEMNMPLAISRARIFWKKTPRSHLTYMDLVQISCEGLMSAIDKFVLPYTPVFRSVAIGRVVGNLIENYSETLVHFYPQDKRKIYRANKAMSMATMMATVSGLDAEVDYEKLAERVNQGLPQGQSKTNAAEISGLVAAASTVSTDSAPPTMEEPGIVSESLEKFAADEATQPDVCYEEAEAIHVMRDAMCVLTPVECKLLRMKGVHIP